MHPDVRRDGERVLSPVQARRQVATQVLQRARSQSGLTLLVDGFAGMGKTFFLRELVEAARADGPWSITAVRADEIESNEPYSFIERFVANSLIPDWHFAPDAQTTPIPVARECVQRLVKNTDVPGRLVVIDDAQWVDAESQRVLRYLIPRVTRRNVLLAFGARSPHAPGSFGEFLRELVTESPLDARLTMKALDAHEVTALLVERLGVGVSVHTAQDMIDNTGGSFLEIDSLISTLTPSEIAQLHVAWEGPRKTATPASDPLLSQYMSLDRTAQATVEIVCLAGHELTVSDLMEAARILDEPLSIEDPINAGVLVRSEFTSMIMPRHALLSDAISERVPRDRARRVLRALADVTTGYRSLRHTLLSAEAWNQDLHDQVDNYAFDATEAAKYSSVVEVLRAALNLAVEPQDRAELLESLALVHLRAKNSYLMLDLIDEVRALPPSLLHEFMYLVLAAHRIQEELPRDVVQHLLTAEPRTPDERTLLAFAAFMLVILTMRSANIAMVPQLIEHAKRLVRQSPRSVRELQDRRLGWMVAKDEYLVVLDCYRMVHDQMNADFERVGEALPGLISRTRELEDGALKVDAMVAIAGAQLAVGDVSTARATMQEGVDLLDRGREPWAASTARLILAHCMLLHGEHAEATELMELAEEVTYSSLDVETRSSWAALRVTLSAIRGLEHAEVYLEQAKRQRDISWEGYGPDLGVMAECELARSQGDFERVLAVSSDPWTDRMRNTRRGFLTFRAQALIETGRLDDAASLIDRLARWRRTKWQEYWGSLDWLRARLAEERGDNDTAQWHYEAATELREFPVPYALALADFGSFLLRLGRHDDGVSTLKSAQQVLEDTDALGYVPMVEARLRNAVGDMDETPGRVRLLSTLTERERQIAEHLAKGRSNNQIAESLVVSVATVRSHVSNVLRKLNVSSRGEVAKLFRASSQLSHAGDGRELQNHQSTSERMS